MSLIKEFQKMVGAIENGQKTANEVKGFAFQLVEKFDELVQEVEKTYTVAELRKKNPNAYSDAKKAQLASGYATEIVNWFTFLTNNSLSFAIEGSYRESWRKAVNEAIGKITDEALAQYAQSVKDALAEKQKTLDGMLNPITLVDFKRRISSMGEGSLTPEMQKSYDRLMYEATAGGLKQVAETEVGQVALGDTTMSIKKSWHTKQNCDIWLVQLSERVEREKYNELAEKAKKWGSRWNSYPTHDKSNHGFLFFNEADAIAFCGLQEGSADTSGRLARLEREKQEKAKDRLSEYARNKLTDSQSILNQSRLTNTYRRVCMAAHTEASAREVAAFASTVGNVADAIENGTAGELVNIRFASQLETLCFVLRQAWGDSIREEIGHYVPSEQWRPIKETDIAKAVYPWPWIRPWLIKDLISSLKSNRGIAAEVKFVEALLKSDRPVLNGRHKLEAFNAVLEKSTLGRWERGQIEQQMIHHKRLQALGIQNLPSLRHVLRQLLPFYETAGKSDPLVTAERKLVGMKIPGFFPTPAEVVEKMIDLARIDRETDYKILEPSAGKGNIVDGLMAYGLSEGTIIECLEVNSSLREILRMKGYCLRDDDFLAFSQTGYDRILMNPPFEDGQDFEHLRHAVALLKEGGVVACIVANGATYQKNKSTLDQLGFVAHDEELPAGTFRESGTNVSSRLIVIER